MIVESFICSILPSVKSSHLEPACAFRLDHLWEGGNHEGRTDEVQELPAIFSDGRLTEDHPSSAALFR